MISGDNNNDNGSKPTYSNISLRCVVCNKDINARSKGVLDTFAWRIMHQECEERMRVDVEKEVTCCEHIKKLVNEFKHIRYNVFDNCFAVYYEQILDPSKSYVINHVKFCPFCGAKLFVPNPEHE